MEDSLGGLSVHTPERAVWRYRRSLPEFVWDAAQLEGNPFTYPEVQTLMDGVTVGGRKVSDERQVLALADASREVLDLVTGGEFVLEKATSDRLHAIIARDEALESGMFRGEGTVMLTPGVSLGEHGRYLPPETEPGGGNLRALYSDGVAWLAEEVSDVAEEAMAYFLFAVLQQFYFHGSKRTGRSMMNGHLMAHGIDAISVPAARRQEFNAEMVRFYLDRDATRMLAFLLSCHPEHAGY
ncbi:cell filamentation protein Fic [Actinomadura darangshiensis]|uniref:Cell filamentation protein Fic n=1 Tax=Actinomadura darangshiensis TaxID=705336 RepID=A0A4R5AV82_9ACTN|nr:cell filamentation protein Fic [Actinomadura darangshiensis]